MHCMTATLLKCWYTTDFFPQNILFMTAIFWNISQKEYTVKSFNSLYYPVETGCKLNKHKTSRRRLGRLMYVQFTSSVSTGKLHQRHFRRIFGNFHNVVARSKMRAVPTSVFHVVTKQLSAVIKTLPRRCCNVPPTVSIGFLGHFTTGYSDYFPFIET